MSWTIFRIDEADFGCEERMPGEAIPVLVALTCDDGRMTQFEVAENWLLSQGLDEGDEWPEDLIDESEGKLDRAQLQNEWMDSYLEAVEEMEEGE